MFLFKNINYLALFSLKFSIAEIKMWCINGLTKNGILRKFQNFL